jgi:hypothetical protein
VYDSSLPTPNGQCQAVTRVDPGPAIGLNGAADLIPWTSGELVYGRAREVRLKWSVVGERRYDGTKIAIELRGVFEELLARWDVVLPPGQVGAAGNLISLKAQMPPLASPCHVTLPRTACGPTLGRYSVQVASLSPRVERVHLALVPTIVEGLQDQGENTLRSRIGRLADHHLKLLPHAIPAQFMHAEGDELPGSRLRAKSFKKQTLRLSSNLWMLLDVQQCIDKGRLEIDDTGSLVAGLYRSLE